MLVYTQCTYVPIESVYNLEIRTSKNLTPSNHNTRLQSHFLYLSNALNRYNDKTTCANTREKISRTQPTGPNGMLAIGSFPPCP